MNKEEFKFKKEEKISNIIDEYIYKDIADIIKSYLFVKCKYCSKKGLVEFMYDEYSGGFYCIDCVTEGNIKKCKQCYKYYNCIIYHTSCVFCVFSCFVYCPHCCKDTYEEINDTSLTDYTEPELTHLEYFWSTTSRNRRENLYQQFLLRLEDIY